MNGQMEERLQQELQGVKTVRDLQNYLRTNPLPGVAKLINAAIYFFAQDCREENKRKDWTAIKKRKQLGLWFQLMDDMVIDRTIAEALRTWIRHHDYGRTIKTPLVKPCNQAGRTNNPREEALCILKVCGSKNE